MSKPQYGSIGLCNTAAVVYAVISGAAAALYHAEPRAVWMFASVVTGLLVPVLALQAIRLQLLELFSE